VRSRAVLPAAIALAALLAFNALASPGFLALEWRDGRLVGSLVDILDRAAPVAIVSLGMALVIATGGVDLSVGAVMAIAGAVAARLGASGASPLVAIVAALGVALAAGFGNGLLVTALSLPPIVATLVLMVAGRGVAQLVSGGAIVPIDDPVLAFLGNESVLSLPFPVVLAFGSLLLLSLSVRRTATGLFVEATGGNATASRVAGVDVRAVRLLVFALSGLLSGVAGLVVASDIRAADSNNAGLYVELDAILATVVGGAALGGGRFSLAGAFIGAVALQALTTTILSRGVAVEWTLVLKAAVVLLLALLQSERVREAWAARRRAA
jgi:galactofuranose transport system permease protein